MKIIKVDNFDRETVNDILVCENVSEYYGGIITDTLNEKLSGDYSDSYFRLVDDGCELYEFKV